MKITLPNGMTLEGTEVQVLETAKKLGYENYTTGYYYSTSHGGYIKISEMAGEHLRNAILKGYREWVTNLSSITNSRTLLMRLSEGPSDKTWLALVEEYAKRV